MGARGLRNHPRDLVVLEVSAAKMSKAIALNVYRGNVLLLDVRGRPYVETLCELERELGIAMLPPLATPFRSGELRASVSAYLPVEKLSSPPVTRPKTMRG